MIFKRKEEKNSNKFKKLIFISFSFLLIFLFILTNVIFSFFFKNSEEITTIGAVSNKYLAGEEDEAEGGLLSDYDLSKVVSIKGSEEEGYYFDFPEEIFKIILDKTLFNKGIKYGDLGTDDIDALMEFIKAEIFTGLPNISKNPEETKTDGDKIQGAVKFKRKSFDREIGEYEEEVEGDNINDTDTSEHIIAIDAGHGDTSDGKVTDNLDNIASSEKELNEGKAKYLQGESGKDSEGNEYKEWELNQKVVDLVIEKLQKYPSIKVVQSGKNEPDYLRLDKAIEDYEAEAYISVHFKSSDENRGTEVWMSSSEYEQNGKKVELGNNDESAELGNILLNSISRSTNMGKTYDNVVKYYNKVKSVLKTSEECGIPNVYVFANTMDTDVLDEMLDDNEKGLDKYAEGIVNGILEYFDAKDNVSKTEEINEKINERYLTYITPENFDKMINSGNEEVLNHFTLDEDMKLIYATWSYSDSEGKVLSKSMGTDYKTKIQQYIMPFQYPLAFLLDTEDEDFSVKLAQLSANSDLIITLFDNVTVSIDKVITTVTTESKTQTYYIDDMVNGKPNTTRSKPVSGELVTNVHEPNVETNMKENVNTSLELTYADSWCIKYEKFYTQERTDSGFVKVGETERTEGGWTNNVVQKNTENIDGINRVHYEETFRREITEVENQNRTITYTFKQNPNKQEVLEGNTNKFITLLRAHSHVALSNIESDYGEGLIEILSSRAATINMVELTKWLLQETSRKIYFGLVEYDFKEYLESGFGNWTGFYGGTVEEKVWFALKDAGYSEISIAGVMGNIYAESGFNPAIIEIKYGVGFGLCQWSHTRRTQLEGYAASKGIDPSDLDTQIEFLLAELTPGGGANGFAVYQLGGRSDNYDGRTYVGSDWENATDIYTAAVAFMGVFERPGKSTPNITKRVTKAEEYYNEFKGREKPVGSNLIGKIELSAENAIKMTQLLNEAVRIANDDRYTYSQANRYGEFQYDCSSLVARLYKKFFDFDAPSTTRGYGSAYYVGPEGSVELQPGDILWKTNPGHVEIYIGNGLRVGAHTDTVAGPDQISVENYKPGYFTKVYRFITD